MRFTYKGLKIRLSEDVYEPSDDTYLLAESMEISKDSDVLEIGTGTGIIAMLASKYAKHVTAVDITDEAVSLAKSNAGLNNIENMTIKQSDLFSGLGNKMFDMIIFNTPYLPQSEDEKTDSPVNNAWDGGPDGRKVIGRFLEDAGKHLKEAGIIYMVESSLSSYQKSLSFLKDSGFDAKVIARKKLFFETLVVIRAERQMSSKIHHR